MDETTTTVQDAMDTATPETQTQETAQETVQAVDPAAPAEAAAEPATPAASETDSPEETAAVKPEAAEAKETDAEEGVKAQPDRQAEVLTRIYNAELRAAAAMAGVPKERIPYLLRLCDRTGADAPDGDMATLAEQAVQQALTDIPELKGAVPAAGSLGDHKRLTGTAEEAAANAFARALRG